MSKSVNHVEIIGHLGRDPELRYTPTGKPVVTISVATSMEWTDKATQERREATEWHRVVCYSHTAKFVGDYLKKGAFLRVVGRLKTRSYKGSDNVEHWTTEVICEDLMSLDKKPAAPNQSPPNGFEPGADDDIPG